MRAKKGRGDKATRAKKQVSSTELPGLFVQPRQNVNRWFGKRPDPDAQQLEMFSLGEMSGNVTQYGSPGWEVSPSRSVEQSSLKKVLG